MKAASTLRTAAPAAGTELRPRVGRAHDGVGRRLGCGWGCAWRGGILSNLADAEIALRYRNLCYACPRTLSHMLRIFALQGARRHGLARALPLISWSRRCHNVGPVDTIWKGPKIGSEGLQFCSGCGAQFHGTITAETRVTRFVFPGRPLGRLCSRCDQLNDDNLAACSDEVREVAPEDFITCMEQIMARGRALCVKIVDAADLTRRASQARCAACSVAAPSFSQSTRRISCRVSTLTTSPSCATRSSIAGYDALVRTP